MNRRTVSTLSSGQEECRIAEHQMLCQSANGCSCAGFGSANRAEFRPELGVNLPYIGTIASSAHDSIPDVPREACLPAISRQQAIFTHVSVGMPINRA